MHNKLTHRDILELILQKLGDSVPEFLSHFWTGPGIPLYVKVRSLKLFLTLFSSLASSDKIETILYKLPIYIGPLLVTLNESEKELRRVGLECCDSITVRFNF